MEANGADTAKVRRFSHLGLDNILGRKRVAGLGLFQVSVRVFFFYERVEAARVGGDEL